MWQPGAVSVIVTLITPLRERDAIDQAQVNHVDRNLGVVALAQDLVNVGFGNFYGGVNYPSDRVYYIRSVMRRAYA